MELKMTEMQKAYFVGRNDESNKETGTHLYIEILYNGKFEIFEDSLNKVIRNQPFLRAEIINGFKFKFNYYKKYKVQKINGNRNCEDQIKKIRNKLSHKIYNIGDNPLYTIQILGENDEYRVFVSIDLLIADGLSLYQFCHEIQHYIDNSDDNGSDRMEDVIYISKYYENKRVSNRYFKARDYYLNNLETIYSAPQLNYKKNSNRKIQFDHLEFTLDKHLFKEIQLRSKNEQLGITEILLNVYSMVLGKWSRDNKMSINVTTFLRPRNKKYYTVIGDYTTSMLVQTNVNKDSDFVTETKKMNHSIVHAYKNSLFEVPEIIQEMSKLNPATSMPIVFTSMLFDNSDLWTENFKCDYLISQTSNVYLDCQVKKNGEELNITWDFNSDILENIQVKMMFNEYVMLLKKYADGEKNLTEFYDEYNTVESVSIYEKFNFQEKIQYNVENSSLKELFISTVEKFPNKTFLIHNGSKITFKEIYELSNEFAKYIKLLKLECNKNKTRVAIKGEKNINSIVKMIAAVINGDSFCYINNENGKEKTYEILDQLENYVFISENNDDIICSLCNNIVSNTESYVLFTSGTTGKPKGIRISEKSVLNTVFDINNKFNVNSDDVILNISNLSFDLSIYDIFASMIVGSECILSNPLHFNVEDIECCERVTIWNSTPLLANEFCLKEHMPNLRLILMSGDYISLDLVDKLENKFSNTTIVALGGATESSIWSNYHICKSSELYNIVPYGKTLQNQSMYIINDNKLCTQNVLGEICIAGQGLSDGYLNYLQSEKSFVHNDILNNRIYKTGDLGYLGYDGLIYIVGRISEEIKHNGFRIDLKEVEKYLNEIDYVVDSYVMLIKDVSGKTKLFAMLETLESNVSVDVRTKLSKKNPLLYDSFTNCVYKKNPIYTQW